MIKNFENFKKVQEVSFGTQWEKTYDDGSTALCVIDNNCTRAMVKAAFEIQEAGIIIECFRKEHMKI